MDLVDHRLLNYLGITESALKWIESYLTNRKLSTVLGDLGTTRMQLTKVDQLQGVPKEAHSYPFCLPCPYYTLGDICRKYEVSFHAYTDDQQNHFLFHPSVEGAKEEFLERLQQCISEI